MTKAAAFAASASAHRSSAAKSRSNPALTGGVEIRLQVPATAEERACQSPRHPRARRRRPRDCRQTTQLLLSTESDLSVVPRPPTARTPSNGRSKMTSTSQSSTSHRARRTPGGARTRTPTARLRILILSMYQTSSSSSRRSRQAPRLRAEVRSRRWTSFTPVGERCVASRSCTPPPSTH